MRPDELELGLLDCVGFCQDVSNDLVGFRTERHF